MRNATEASIQTVIASKQPTFDVMYEYKSNGVTYLVHRKDGRGNIQLPDGYFIMEEYNCAVVQSVPYWRLQAITKKQGTPKKVKAPHVKGTNKFVYSPDNIRVGTKVKCRDGNVRGVKRFDNVGKITVFTDDYCVNTYNGKEWNIERKKPEYKSRFDIIYIFPEEKKQEDAFRARVTELEKFGVQSKEFGQIYVLNEIKVSATDLKLMPDANYRTFLFGVMNEYQKITEAAEALEAAKKAEEERLAKVKQEQEAEAKRLEVIAKEQAEKLRQIEEAQSRIDAEKKRIADEKEAAERAKQHDIELAKAREAAAEKAVADEKARVERERIAAEEKAKADEAARIEADKKVAEKMGIKVINLSFKDALWRTKKVSGIRKNISDIVPEYKMTYPTYRFHVTQGVVAKEDDSLKKELGKKLTTLIADSYTFCPIGIGNHVDHILVRDIASRMSKVIFWADFPYLLSGKPDKNFMQHHQLKKQVFDQFLTEKQKYGNMYLTQKIAFPDVKKNDLKEIFYIKK